MARFLFTCWPFPGHLYPQIAIAHALKSQGHDVAVFTGGSAGRVLHPEGLVHLPFDRLDERDVYDVVFHGRRGGLDWRGVGRFMSTLRKWLLETIPAQIADLESIRTSWRPDVIATDPTFWAPILVLREKWNIPVAVSSFVPVCMIPGRDAPPFGLGLPPPRGLATRALSRAVTLATAVTQRGFRRTANELRRVHGLPPIAGSVTEFSGTMPLYLVPGVPEFDYNRTDLPASVRYVGPCLWNSPQTEPPPAWFGALPRDAPWVHVTEGTVHVDAPFVLQAAARGLAGLRMQVILTTGTDRDPAALGLAPLAPNVNVARWLSHRDLLPHTDLVVTTGGAGTVLAALEAGVPLILVPTEWDKPEIARRVVLAGAGVWLPPRACTPRRLRRAVERVLHTPAYHANARRLSKLLRERGGAEAAARHLEGLVPREVFG